MSRINSRIKENYSSVYHIKPSSKVNDLQECYDQFIEYKLQDMYHEACNMTINVLANSELKYYDALFPTKKTYIFKAYSRKYLQNTLMPTVWVSIPANNIGYVCILLTETGNLILISTLSNVSVIKNISHIRNHHLLQRNWYDEEYEIAFKDVIFDIFDLI